MSVVVGLSGTVASGKDFVAQSFKKLGAVIFDADKEVHKIFDEDKEVFGQVKEHFPEAILNQKIDRRKLGDLVFNNQENLNILEEIVHPVVNNRKENFIKKADLEKKKLVILNIPLLFEKGGYLKCHKNILVTAPKSIQRQRFLDRAKNNNSDFKEDLLSKKFEDILQNQIPNSDKKKLADFIIDNGKDKGFTFEQVKKIFNQLIA